MDSLFATYASSDDEDDHHHPPPQQQPPPSNPNPNPKPTSSLFSSLPKPFSSTSTSTSTSSSSSSTKPSSLFSLLPPPTSQITPLSSPNPIPIVNPKKVIQFHPPQFSSRPINEDEDEDDEEIRQEKEAKKRKQSAAHDTSIKSFLSAMPAPKNSSTSSLGTASSGARRSIIDTGPSPAPTPTPTPAPVSEVGIEQNTGYADYAEVGYGGGGGYVGYGEGEQQVQYYDDGSSWSNNGVSSSMVEGVSTEVASFVGMGGGRRRKDQVPPQIVEVKQDELMKNRPTEDKSKLTGLAFGPSYQPASSKGKPSKLHKRKHQIGSLYFDMRQNEPELAERRAKGFLTKAETHAKYGW